MQRGPNGERRKGDAAQVAVQVCRILTGEEEEDLPGNQRNGGLVGGKQRAERLTPEQRSEIARKGAEARWHKPPAA